MAATGHAKWIGNIESGEAKIDTGSGLVTGTVTAASRFADGEGTNPEELLGAAHAACFSMALTLILGEAGHDSESIETEATVYLRRIEDGFEIHKIELDTERHGARDQRRGLPEVRRDGQGRLPGLEGPRRPRDHARGEARLVAGTRR